MGEWTYVHNALGEVVSQTDAKGQRSVPVRKSDAGMYAYLPGSHRLSSVSAVVGGPPGGAIGYDANGNIVSGAGRTVAWTSFNMPASITRGAQTTAFAYGADHQRVRQESGAVTTYYVGADFEKEVTNGGTTEYKTYVQVGGRPIGVFVERSDGTGGWRFFHRDHLGSVAVVSDGAGNVLERMGYDAWGHRRGFDGSELPPNASAPQTDRGYTGHEMLDGVGLVHMNGRVYDALLGRFLSADPFVQDPTSTQSYNRYAYVMNQPLSATDPSGYIGK